MTGGADLARKVVNAIDNQPNNFSFAYDVELRSKSKIRAIAQKGVRRGRRRFQREAAAENRLAGKTGGLDKCPSAWRKPNIPSATTPNSLAVPKDSRITVRGITVSAGAGFIVACAST